MKTAGSLLFGAILATDLVILVVYLTCTHPHGESVVCEQLACLMVVAVLLAFGALYSREDRRDHHDDSGDNN